MAARRPAGIVEPVVGQRFVALQPLHDLPQGTLPHAQRHLLLGNPAFGDDVEEMMKEVMHQPEENIAMLRSVIKIE